MKKRFLKFCRTSVKKTNYNDEKIEEIMYGLEAIYLTITKMIIILGASFILGIFKEVIFMTFTFALIRNFGFGVHASNSWICLLSSLLVFLLIAYLSAIIVIGNILILIIGLLCIFCYILYAPADTIKRPIINKKKRTILKVLSVLVGITFMFVAYFVNNSTISNILVFSLIIEAIMILPITYKIFNQKYSNYKYYKPSI